MFEVECEYDVGTECQLSFASTCPSAPSRFPSQVSVGCLRVVSYTNTPNTNTNAVPHRIEEFLLIALTTVVFSTWASASRFSFFQRPRQWFWRRNTQNSRHRSIATSQWGIVIAPPQRDSSG